MEVGTPGVAGEAEGLPAFPKLEPELSADTRQTADGSAQNCDSDEETNEPSNAPAIGERKKGLPWTESEHRLFLLGLNKLGKGDWRGISRHYVSTRTPTQVASHAQKHFIRQSSLTKRKRRSSLFDITGDGPQDSSANGTSMTHYESVGGTMSGQQCGMLPSPGLQAFPGGAFSIPGMEGYLLDSQVQAYQQAAAMQAAASQEAFAASMGQAQANQAAQLVQQAAMAGFTLCPAQAAQMAQQATFYAHQAFAQQQAAFFVQAQQQQQQHAVAMMQAGFSQGGQSLMGAPSGSVGGLAAADSRAPHQRPGSPLSQLSPTASQLPPLPPHVGGAMSAAAGQEAVEEEYRRWQRAHVMPAPYGEEAEVQGACHSSGAFGNGKLFRPTASHAPTRGHMFSSLPLFAGALDRSSGGSDEGTEGGSRPGPGSSREGSDLGCTYELDWKSGSSRTKWQPSQWKAESGGPGFGASQARSRRARSPSAKPGSDSSAPASSSQPASSFQPASSHRGEQRSAPQEDASEAPADVGLCAEEEPPSKRARTDV